MVCLFLASTAIRKMYRNGHFTWRHEGQSEMCFMGWRRKTDASEAASESDFQKHIALVFF